MVNWLDIVLVSGLTALITSGWLIYFLTTKEEVIVEYNEEEVQVILDYHKDVVSHYTTEIMNTLNITDEETIKQIVSSKLLPSGESVVYIAIGEFTIASVFNWQKNKVRINTYDMICCKSRSKKMPFQERVDMTKAIKFISKGLEKYLLDYQKELDEKENV